MKNLAITILCLLFICLSVFAFGQKQLIILKDSICYNHNYYQLQELKLPAKDIKIYKKIQNSYDIFGGLFFENPEKRLNAKKTTLKKLLSEDILKDTQYGFEKYNIFFNRNKILNISIEIQSYGSPWEDTQYFCFDIDNDVEIGNALYINQSKLLQLCNKKLKEESKSFVMKDLSKYRIDTNGEGKIMGISFIFFDFSNRTNSGYPQYQISFSWNEIEKYISPKYKKLLLKT